MNHYLSTRNNEIREFLKILSPVFPDWLFDYINTPAMQRIDGISISCGMDYSGCFDVEYFYSNLDHSVGVALIIWNFTNDKKQALSGLFHDISTPVFKHCIDFMHGDSENQEITEESTRDFIIESKEIMDLLSRDGIDIDDVCDYKMYPIADNDTPKLSADRFEYTFSSGLSFFRVWNLDVIKRIYSDIVLLNNEDGSLELGFKSLVLCEEYIRTASKLWPKWIGDSDRIAMQFIADTCSRMNDNGYLSVDDLYKYSESEVIEKILNCNDKNIADNFKNFQKANCVYNSDYLLPDKYCVRIKAKIRYINPLVLVNEQTKRISDVSEIAKKCIDDYLSIKQDKYIYYEFDYKK